MSRAETSARNYDPGLMEGIPIWLKHLDPTGATNNQVVTFDGNLGEWVNGWGGALFGATSGLVSTPDISPTTSETFLGYHAGTGASTNGTVFLGVNAGNGANGADNSVFIGEHSGDGAVNATNSMFLGYYSGYGATDASYSSFFGQEAGYGAANGYNSMYAGFRAGKNAFNANDSIFLGYQSGLNDTVDNSSGPGWSILIGSDTSTGGFGGSIAIGKGATNTQEAEFYVADEIIHFSFRGVNYTFPAANAAGVLTNDGSGNLSWS